MQGVALHSCEMDYCAVLEGTKSLEFFWSLKSRFSRNSQASIVYSFLPVVHVNGKK